MSSLADLPYEQRLRMIFEQVSARVMLTLDAQGHIVDWPPAAMAMFGWNAEEIVGKSFSLLFTPEDTAAGIPATEMRQATELGHAPDVRWLVRKDGTRFFVDGVLTALKLDDGAVAGFVKILHEATAAKQLQESEELFRSLVTATSQVVWRTDAKGQVIYDSPSARAFTGQSFEEWKGGGWLNALHPDDRADAAAVWVQAVRDGAKYENEFRIRHASGQYRWAAVRGAPIRDHDGTLRGWVGTVTDITDKKQIELKLHEARLRTQAILSAGEIGTWMFDLAGNRVHADANFARLFGVMLDHEEGVPPEVYYKALHPDDAEMARQRVARAIADGKPYQDIYRVRIPEGGWRYLHVRGKVDYGADGAPAWMPGVALDITALRTAKEALHLREERYRALFDAIEEGFYIIELIYDENGHPFDYRFLEANPATEKLNGLCSVVGKTLREVVSSPTMRWVELYDQVVKTGQSMRFVDYSHPLKRWFDISVTRLDGEARHQVALLFSDITETKHNEEELRRLATDLSQANRRQREFLATLAHELRNPLAPIRTGLDLMHVAMNAPEPIARVHDMMSRQVSHLVNLVDDLLDLARISNGKIELKRARCLLKDVVQSAVETSLPAIEEKRHDLAVELTDEPIWMNADPNRLGQVIGNLLTNAAKYTPAGGRIVLVLAREDDAVLIRVSDNGIGIAPEDLPHLFDMFSQVGRDPGQSQGGLGIGLHLVKQLTEMHGGAVSAFSAGLGQGSTFTLRFPVEQRAADSAAGDTAVAADRPASDKPLTIVVADDNREATLLLTQLLEIHGHTVVPAYDGNEALAVIKSMRPDLAVLDIGMPQLTGHDVARAIRNDPELGEVALAAITGWSSEDDRVKSAEAGFDFHLAKPVSYTVMLDLIDKVKRKRFAQ